MDVSFTNVLEGARQYFQGLPAPSTTVTTGPTNNHAYNNQPGKTLSTLPSDSRYEENKPNNTDGNTAINSTPPNTNQGNDTYWSAAGPNELRTMVEPYAPQPTRVEVPDTRPDDGRPECNGSPATSLTEMQPPSRNIQSQRQEHHHHHLQQQQQQQQQQHQQQQHQHHHQHSAASPSPQLHQMEPPKSHSPPVYQQLNNVKRSSSYHASEVLNSHSTYQTVERPPAATPIVAQRAQYYPRYHHPDITKSAPAPFSQSSVYQTPQPNTSTTSTAPMTRTTAIEQGNSMTIPHRRNSQQEQQQQASSVYTGPQAIYPTGNNAHHNQQPTQHHHHLQQLSHHGNRPTAMTNSHNQVQLLHHPNDVSSVHSNIKATTTNPCSPRHGSHSHIPSSSHNHPGHIPSPHLPVASVPPPQSLSAVHALPQQQQQPQSQQNQHSSRINTSYSNRIIPYSSSTHNPMTNSQQQLLLPPPPPQQSSSSSTAPSPSSNYQAGVTNNHESNHHASPSPHRQSPHVSVHNPHAISPHHNPSPHHTPSPHNSTNFQPHSPTYPPPPSALPLPTPTSSSSSMSSTSSRVQTHVYPSPTPHRSAQHNYPSGYPTSYHSYQKTQQSGIYPQTLRTQYGQQPQSSSTLNQQQTTSNIPISTATSDVNGISYLTTNKSTAFNGSDPKRNSGINTGPHIHTNPATSYGSYRMPTTLQRNANTHNLPIAAVSSYHSNRNSREALGKAQTVSRPRLSTINTAGANSISVCQPTVTTALSSRKPEYTSLSSSVNSATTTTASYSVYNSDNNSNNTNSNHVNNINNNNQQQQSYRNYSTSVAPSHSGNNSSTCTALTSNAGDTRSSTLPNATIHHARTSSDQTSRLNAYSSSHLNDNNYHSYKEYSYANSSSAAAAASSSSSSSASSSSLSTQPHHQIPKISSPPPPPPPPQSSIPVNGLPFRKRESPLDLSVKTIKTSADSTARDDLDNAMADKQVSSTSLSSARTNRGILPSVNVQSPSPYVTYDTRGTNNGARNSASASLRPLTPQMPVCAPKVDFLPNFNSTPLRHNSPSHQHNTTTENPLRRSSSQQLYIPPTQHQNSMPLPNMSTFKKSSLPNTATLYDNKRGVLTSSHPSVSEPPGGGGRGIALRYPSVDSQRSMTIPVHEYPDTNKYYLDGHNKYHTSSSSRDRMTNKRPGDSGYTAGASAPSKQPRMDNWKLVIDQEIQQKLEVARVLHEQQKRHELTLPRAMPNGTLAPPGAFNSLRIDNNNHCQTSNSIRHQAYGDKRIYPESKISRDTVATAAYTTHPIEKSVSTPSGGGIQPLVQTTTTASQAAYPTGYRQGQRSPYNCSQTLPDQPSNTGADKRVLSLLRNSLENKQQREEQLNSQQPILVNHSQQSFQNKVVAPVEPKTNIGRHNLSPFTAASLLERNSNTPPHYKFHVPRAVDSITQENPRSLYGSRVNSSATLPAGKEALLGPREHENQIHRDKDDSLAAILAAKIRTKAELKQVGTGQFTSSKPVILPSQDAASADEFERVASTSTPQSVASSAASPPKLTREKTASLPPRRRLFSRSEEENMPVAATIPAPAPIIAAVSAVVASRTSGFRSSSETSVFDFRESDSESEMPVLERQTLEEMRRDRKQLSKVQPPVSLDDAMCIGIASSNDLVKIELKENDNVNEVDPFWMATCDKFMEQLRSGEALKKRGRKRKVDDTSKHEDIDKREKENNSRAPSPVAVLTVASTVIKQEDIKQEIINDEIIVPKCSGNIEGIKIDSEDSTKITEVRIKSEAPEDDDCNNSGEDSDEPLIKRKTRRKKKKVTDSDCDEGILPRKNKIRRGSRIKLESSSASEGSSDDDSDGSNVELGPSSSVAHRLRARKRSSAGSAENEGMKLRSRDMGTPKSKDDKTTKTPTKNSSVQKPKPKPLFGDGSDFRPGWEEEVYVYKKSLRMPTRLINVSKPSRFHRLSTSLPDLDPGSPALSVSMDSTDLCLTQKRNVDSDLESNYSFSMAGLGGKIEDEEATSSTTVSCPPKTTSRQTRSESNSIIDVLARKVGGNGKKDLRKKSREKFEKSGNNKILPKGSNEPELLATPSLTPLMNNDALIPKLKGKTPIKNNKSDKSTKPINITNSSYLLGYFRKETVNNFRDTFRNNHALPNEFSTFVLKSRTRTETRVLKKQTTIREVFGEDRPASAPPMQNHAGDTSQDDDSQTETKESSILGRERTLKQKVVNRLRNVGFLRSHKAIINSKRHLLTVQRRKVLLKSLTEEKLQRIKKETTTTAAAAAATTTKEVDDEVVVTNSEVTTREDEEEDEEDDDDETELIEPDVDNNDETEIPNKKKLKLRTGRRKFRSGFDYIRKKKKPLKKDESNLPRERKRQIMSRPNAECVADLQMEIRTWVIKKGVGETILHRAARLGYTDVTAYCLEKLNSAPSPKDNAGYTPLHEACSRGHLEIAKLLLAYGANASESANGGIRPLHEAAENGATELVRLLLSYGADPLLATYAGQTPLMLAVDTDAHSILEQHLDDVQGRSNVPWSFRGPASIFDCDNTGYNPLDDAPMDNAVSELDEVEIEVSDVNLPVLFSLANDPDKWVLLQDLMSASRVKSRDALLRQINPKAPSGPPSIAHRNIMREFKLPDFLEQSRCCHLLSAGERINVRGSKVTLIKYNDKVRSLLNVERVVINLR